MPRLHPVARVLWDRRRRGSRPGAREDGCRVGLAVEGRGVRGVVSCGMLTAIEQLGLRDAFDVAYGASAGSLNLTYFLTGEAGTGLDLYLDDMGEGLLSLGRLLRREPVLSLDWLFEVLVPRRAPLRWDAVLASPIPLKVLASSVTELRPVALSGFGSAAELRAALQGGARPLMLAGGPVAFRDLRLLDASVLLTHPFETAVGEGCTHVLSLSTRPRGRPHRTSGLPRRLASWHLERVRRGLGTAYLRRLEGDRDAQRRLQELTESPAGEPFVLDAAPPGESEEVRLLDRHLRRVMAGARAGYEAVILALVGRPVRAHYMLGHSGWDKL